MSGGEKHKGRLNWEITSHSGWGSTSQKVALHSVDHQQGGARWRCTHPRSGNRPNAITYVVDTASDVVKIQVVIKGFPKKTKNE